jgi:MFS family permease
MSGRGNSASNNLVPGGNGKRSAWRVLAHGDFRLYFAGSVLSNIGTWLQNTAQVLLVYRLTRSVLAVGVVTCAQFSSPLLLAPWAGMMADRVGTRRVLMTTQLISAVIAALLAALQFGGMLKEPFLIVGAVLIGLAFTFTLPALSVMVPTLVPEADTKAAMAMNSVSYNIGRALAPVIGVVVISTIGFGWAFALNAVSFVIFTATLLAVHPRAVAAAAPGRSRITDGFRIVWSEPRIMLLLAMVAAVTVAADPVLVLGPSLARHVFGASDVWSGYFLSALGAGTILGSFLPTRQATLRGAAAFLGLLGVAIVSFALAPTIWISVVAAMAAGMACLLTGAATQALLLSHAGPRRAAKVMAVWAIAWAGSKPVASLADGWLAGIVGVRATGVLFAVPAIVPALIMVLCPDKAKRFFKVDLKGTTGESGVLAAVGLTQPHDDRTPVHAAFGSAVADRSQPGPAHRWHPPPDDQYRPIILSGRYLGNVPDPTTAGPVPADPSLAARHQERCDHLEVMKAAR